jgi:hypothetical protein
MVNDSLKLYCAREVRVFLPAGLRWWNKVGIRSDDSDTTENLGSAAHIEDTLVPIRTVYTKAATAL